VPRRYLGIYIKSIKSEKYIFSVIFQVYDAPEKIESVDKSVTEINKCGIRRIEAVLREQQQKQQQQKHNN